MREEKKKKRKGGGGGEGRDGNAGARTPGVSYRELAQVVPGEKKGEKEKGKERDRK